jgi:carboxypeptidase PM20D1
MARNKKAGKSRYAGFKYLAAAAAVALLVLIGIVAFNTSRLEAEPLADAPPPPPPVDGAAVQRLAQALRIPTISSAAGPPSEESLSAFSAHLEQSFPLVHAQLTKEQIGGGSLLYTWPGSDPAAPALLLAAHQDVVPIDAGTESNWSHPAFAGIIADGHVWGRGKEQRRRGRIASGPGV